MWNILEGLSGVTERGGEVRVGMVTGRGVEGGVRLAD